MKITRLIACGFAALSLVGSAYALNQDSQPSDDSSAQIAANEQAQPEAQAQDPAAAPAPTKEKHHAKKHVTHVKVSKVNINTAEAKDIEHAARGLGKKCVTAIVATRSEHPIKSVDDIIVVKGCSKKYVKKHHERLVHAFEF